MAWLGVLGWWSRDMELDMGRVVYMRGLFTGLVIDVGVWTTLEIPAGSGER